MAKKIIPRCCICNDILVNGYCRFCGYDNSRNDRYRTCTNTHSAASTLPLHEGTCESTLNRPGMRSAADRTRAKIYSTYSEKKNTRKSRLFSVLFRLFLVLFCILYLYSCATLPVSLSFAEKLTHPSLVLRWLFILLKNL